MSGKVPELGSPVQAQTRVGPPDADILNSFTATMSLPWSTAAEICLQKLIADVKSPFQRPHSAGHPAYRTSASRGMWVILLTFCSVSLMRGEGL